MRVEIWSDIICPWCYVGRRRFEKALALFPNRDGVEVIGRSFELDPHAPQRFEGSLDELLAGKYGVGIERARAMNAQVTSVAAGEGLEYRLDIARPGNTFDAHRLLHLGAKEGLRAELEERLMQAYFREGREVGDHETLAELAVEVGLDGTGVSALLEGDAYADGVRQDQLRAQRLGANGVPFFVFDERFAVSGAQPAELFGQALEKSWDAARAATG